MKLVFKKLIRTIVHGLLLIVCMSSVGHAAAEIDMHMHHHSAASMTSRKPLSIEVFDENTWSKLLANGPRPAAYLFTTSYCSTCPEAFEVLKKATQNQKLHVELIAVMMDVDGPQAQRHAAHFLGLTQLYAFDGFEPAIRQSVDPTWPNVTPYVVMIDRKGRTQKSIGQPNGESLKKWLQ